MKEAYAVDVYCC